MVDEMDPACQDVNTFHTIVETYTMRVLAHLMILNLHHGHGPFHTSVTLAATVALDTRLLCLYELCTHIHNLVATYMTAYRALAAAIARAPVAAATAAAIQAATPAPVAPVVPVPQPPKTALPNVFEGKSSALDELAKRWGWKFNHIRTQEMAKEQQLALMADTMVHLFCAVIGSRLHWTRMKVLVGIHGNSLTHLVAQPPTSFTTVIEIFHPDSFAFNYGWTENALGHMHFTVWNDTSTAWPNHPKVEYLEGFQGDHIIPMHGLYVAQLIERQLDTSKGNTQN
jgi:hypothetical protein